MGFLSFFVTLQRELPGLSSANVTIAYTPTELAIAGIQPGSADEAKLVVAAFDGTTYTSLASSVETVGRTVTATGVTTFGETFVVAHPDVGPGFLPPLVAGRGSLRNVCRGEFEVVDATNTPFVDARGRVNTLQVCHDGDPTCDADRTKNGTCVFRLAVCFHVTDPLCSPVDVTAFQLEMPSVRSRNATDAANAQAVLNAVKTLGTLAGKQVTFSPAIAAPRCSPAIGFLIGTKPGKRQMRARTLDASGAVNFDRLKLRCLPS